MDEHTPLYIWSSDRPTPQQLEILKAAKRATGLDILVKPARAIPGCGRVLSFEGRPPFACEWAPARGYDDPRLPDMIRWVITGEGGRPKRIGDWLAEVMGVEHVEVREEPYP